MDGWAHRSSAHRVAASSLRRTSRVTHPELNWNKNSNQASLHSWHIYQYHPIARDLCTMRSSAEQSLASVQILHLLLAIVQLLLQSHDLHQLLFSQINLRLIQQGARQCKVWISWETSSVNVFEICWNLLDTFSMSFHCICPRNLALELC